MYVHRYRRDKKKVRNILCRRDNSIYLMYICTSRSICICIGKYTSRNVIVFIGALFHPFPADEVIFDGVTIYFGFSMSKDCHFISSDMFYSLRLRFYW